MRVAIDARYLRVKNGHVHPESGIGCYTWHLIQNLVELAPDLEFTLLVSAANEGPLFPSDRLAVRTRIREIPVAAPANSLRTLAGFSIPARALQADLFHSPFNILPSQIKGDCVTTIHDVMCLESPQLFSNFAPLRFVLNQYYRLGIGRALRCSRHVFTVSERSKRAILAHAPWLEDHITVTYNSVDPFFQPIFSDESLEKTQHIVGRDTKFVLCVGQGSPFKNHPRAILGFLEAYRNEPDVKLVLVRRLSQIDPSMAALLRMPEVRDKVIFASKVERETLRALYNRASALLFPSLQEGFGIPILEAMACGTPVVTSDIEVLREVGGDAAIFVNPYEPESIAQGLLRLEHDDTLRQELIRKGLSNVNRFSWKTCAEKTLNVYRFLLEIDFSPRTSLPKALQNETRISAVEASLFTN